MEEVRNPYAAPEAPVGQPMDARELVKADRGLPSGPVGAIPCLGAVFSLADAVAIFGDDKHCLHDKSADTIVAVA